MARSNFEFRVKKNSELTNLDYFDFWMKSIHSHAAKISDANLETINEQITTIKLTDANEINFKKSSLSPPILIVGTNRNELPGDQITRNDLVKQKFDKIKEFIADKIYAKHIIEPYFAIDTLTDTTNHYEDAKKDQNDVDSLKKTIELAAINESYMGEQQPVKWMKFEKSLDKLKNKGLFYASLSQVKSNIIKYNYFLKLISNLSDL